MSGAPTWKTCSASGCNSPVYDPSLPYCDTHVPITSWVSDVQAERCKRLLAKGYGLYQSARLVQSDPRDMDVALWERIGGRPEGQF